MNLPLTLVFHGACALSTPFSKKSHRVSLSLFALDHEGPGCEKGPKKAKWRGSLASHRRAERKTSRHTSVPERRETGLNLDKNGT